jgi:hypothetical protein
MEDQMMCQPGERDLAHAARRAIIAARAEGHGGEALIEAATDAVATVWAHLDRTELRAAVVSCLERDLDPPPPPSG